MKFIFDGKSMVAAEAFQAPQGPLDWVVGGSVDKFMELVADGALVLLKAALGALPNIMGFATVLAGACIIISAVTGHGIMKPMSYYGIAMIITVCARMAI